MNRGKEYRRVVVVLFAFVVGWLGATEAFGRAVLAIDPSQRSSPAAYEVMRAPHLLDSTEGGLLWLAAAGVFMVPGALSALVSQPGLSRRWLWFPSIALLARVATELWPLRFRLPFHDGSAGPVVAVGAATLAAAWLLAMGFAVGLVCAVVGERMSLGRGLAAATRQDRVARRQRERLG